MGTEQSEQPGSLDSMMAADTEPPEIERLEALDRDTITGLVRRSLEIDDAEALEWRFERLQGSFGFAGSIYRFHGTARHGGRTADWSLMLKVARPVWPGSENPAHRAYWKREWLAYESGFLNRLRGGIAAPRCFDAVEASDDECWLWLEEVDGELGTAWPVERFGLAARHLGKFNAAYLGSGSWNRRPWLSRRFLRDWVAESEDGIAKLPDCLDHPVVRTMFPGDLAQRASSATTDSLLS